MWVYVSIATVTVVTLAWFSIVLVSARLRQTPAQTILDIEKAVEFIDENLPEEVLDEMRGLGMSTSDN